MKATCIGWTGPSIFDRDGVRMIEDAFESNPMILRQNNMKFVDQSLDACKAVIIAGGIDIHPSMYGSCVFAEHNLNRFDIDRDYRELYIIDHCLKKGKPLFGICRGHQMIGVYHGMEMVQDISDGVVCHAPKGHGITLQHAEPAHWIKLVEDGKKFTMTKEDWGRRSLLHPMLKKMSQSDEEKLWVNSFHHQGIKFDDDNQKEYKKLNLQVYGYAVAATADTKRVVELMGGEGWLSCQWHPEHDWDQNPCSAKVLSKFKEMID